MDVVGFYAGMAFVVMVILAIVNSRLEVDLARPTDVPVGVEEVPLYFAHLHRDLLDLGLVRGNQAWFDRVRKAFGEGPALYEAGEALRLLSRPGRSLVVSATTDLRFLPGWNPEEIGPAMRAECAAVGAEIAFDLDEIEAREGGGYRARLTVGPWTRRLDFERPGDVFREANAILEADGYRVMQFANGNLSHAFALMHLPLARRLYDSALFDVIDPCGGEEVREGGTPEQWSTWLY